MKEQKAGTAPIEGGHCGQSVLCGRSYWGQEITARRLGQGGTSLLFLASLGAEPCFSQVMLLFLEELEREAERDGRLLRLSARALLSARSIYVLPCPNPDAQLIKSGRITEDSPFFQSVSAIRGRIPASLWTANGRGIDPSFNFAHRFALRGGKGPLRMAPFGCGGPYPESEPESAVLARLVRTLRPRLLVHLTKGRNSLCYPLELPALHALCTRYAPFEFCGEELAATLEGWVGAEQGAAFLRISAKEGEGSRLYALLRPLLFALCGY
ncbi:MAG: hypothetical protein IJZ33_05820 [Clostridia bacterium]|nr:hypothetical protein [Clostridia bacterium]